MGSIRYMVSLERADQQTFLVIIILVLAGAFIMLLLTFTGIYFIRSILVPVKQISASAKQIAQGDFDVRIEKGKDDELGQLCDAVNDMAGELGAAERMKNDFISSVSHELRTPLTAIKGWAETLRVGADPITAEKGMTVIIRESERLSGLVEELLDFSRLQSGRMRLSAARLDILAELDEAVYLSPTGPAPSTRTLPRGEHLPLPRSSGAPGPAAPGVRQHHRQRPEIHRERGLHHRLLPGGGGLRAGYCQRHRLRHPPRAPAQREKEILQSQPADPGPPASAWPWRMRSPPCTAAPCASRARWAWARWSPSACPPAAGSSPTRKPPRPRRSKKLLEERNDT